MTGAGDFSTTLTRRLEQAYDWYRGMVNPRTGRLEYLYLPETDRFVARRSPIREIASVWDVALLGEFLGRRELTPLIAETLEHWLRALRTRDERALLDPSALGEPSSIAHSAFLLLALLRAPVPRRAEPIAALAEGILHQQRRDGSYKIYFDDLPDEGEELYAGEAMLALLEAHRETPDTRYVASVEQAFAHYEARYFRAGRVADDMLVFYANWQSQAGRRLCERTQSSSVRGDAAHCMRAMHDRIMESGFYERVRREPERQVSVEVACALEGLNDLYAVSGASAGSTGRDRECICTGARYLLDLQRTRDAAPRERGGFGMTLGDRTQRIDVTGHAASAFMKTLENRIEC